jgi:hypothetical protein
MSELADQLYARADETARADITVIIERGDLDPADPEIRQAIEGTLYGEVVELERAFKHLGIALLDAVPVIGPWALRQLANRP